MTGTTSPLPAATRRPAGAVGFAAAVLSAAIASIVLSAVIAAIAHGAGASHSFKALDIATYTPFIVIGLLAGATAWNIIRNRSAEPVRLLTWLAPTVVAISLVPDIVVGTTGSLTGTSWGGVLALMGMHLVVAVCGVVSSRIFLPLTSGPEEAPAQAG